MKGGIGLSFIAGVLLGGLGVWLLAGPRSIPARPVAPPPDGLEVSRPSTRDAQPAPPAPASPAPGDPGPNVAGLRHRLSEVEAELATARKEARANLLKGALVLEIEGQLPEELMKPLRDVEPTKGLVRFAQQSELMTQMPWMYLHTIVDEDFEEALQRSLDRQLQWTDGLDLAPEERASIRDYTERGFRLMVDLQRRAKTLRKTLAEDGGLTLEDRKALEEKLNVATKDHAVYVRACEPGRRIPRLFPREAAR